jgi:peptidoglycan hydrolase-like protein with peptidoglycan-binding domain
MPGKRRRTGGRLAVGAAVLVIAGTAAAVLVPRLAPPGSGQDDHRGGALPPATATVQRLTLVDRQAQSGQLGHGDSVALAPRLSGTVTAMPTVGAVISRNQVLYRVDDGPVLLLYGGVPAYRELTVGTKGRDVRELEQNLWDVGYRGFTVDTTYAAATATAVRAWQKAVGLPRTGVVELGRVVFEPGPVRVDGQQAVPGDPAQPGSTLFTYTGTARVVTVELPVGQDRLATIGAAVNVRLPNGRTTPGRVTDVRTVVKPAEGNTPATTKVRVAVTVADEHAIAGLDQAAVTVDFTVDQRANVLTVPVAALLALAEGGYGVQVVEGGRTHVLAVHTGLFADGRVEVTGAGLTDGMTVGVPS